MRFHFRNFNKNRQPISYRKSNSPKVPCQSVHLSPINQLPGHIGVGTYWSLNLGWCKVKHLSILLEHVDLQKILDHKKNDNADSFFVRHLNLGTNSIMVMENTMHCECFASSVKMADRRRNRSPTSIWHHMNARLSKPSRASSIPGILFTPVTGVRCFRKVSVGLVIPSGLIASTALEAACPQGKGEVKHTQSSLQLRPKKDKSFKVTVESCKKILISLWLCA